MHVLIVIVAGVVGLVVGYLLTGVVSYHLVMRYSPRPHRDLEAAMTSAFFYGPVGGGLCCVAAVVAAIWWTA